MKRRATTTVRFPGPVEDEIPAAAALGGLSPGFWLGVIGRVAAHAVLAAPGTRPLARPAAPASLMDGRRFPAPPQLKHAARRIGWKASDIMRVAVAAAIEAQPSDPSEAPMMAQQRAAQEAILQHVLESELQRA